MILEVIYKVWPKWFLIFPVLYFGGYGVLTSLSHYEFYKVKRDIDAHNEQINIPYDLEENDLVVASGEVSENHLLTKYDIDYVYVENSNLKSKSHWVNVIGDKDNCKLARKIGYKEGFYTQSINTYSSGSRFGKMVPDVCVIKYPQDPQKGAFIVTGEEKKKDSFLLPQTMKTIVVTSPNQTEYILKGGHAMTFKWFPQPAMGCALNSGAASWDCFAAFSRSRFQHFNVDDKSQYTGDTGRLAKALGLKVKSDDQKYKPIELTTSLSDILENNKKSNRKDTYERFNKLLSQPVEYDSSLDFEIINNDTQYFIDQTPKMIAALQALKPHHKKRDNRNKVIAISPIVAKLPLPILQENSQELLGLFEDSNDGWRWDNMELFIRLGDLGEESHQLLYNSTIKSADIGHSKLFNTLVAYAICRAGSDMAPLVGDLLLRNLEQFKISKNQGYDQQRALYITLARLGMQKEADNVLTNEQVLFHRKTIRETIDINSPPSVCVFQNGEPKYPTDNNN